MANNEWVETKTHFNGPTKKKCLMIFHSKNEVRHTKRKIFKHNIDQIYFIYVCFSHLLLFPILSSEAWIFHRRRRAMTKEKERKIIIEQQEERYSTKLIEYSALFWVCHVYSVWQTKNLNTGCNAIALHTMHLLICNERKRTEQTYLKPSKKQKIKIEKDAAHTWTQIKMLVEKGRGMYEKNDVKKHSNTFNQILFDFSPFFFRFIFLCWMCCCC